eukprot:TRINITY_DN3441_c0_g1_i1.p1 TRINITY_DN3441_c0_g1~~TRINITY_DN3441_c0_g1_i1.p1  ORF type:complete len:159 (-),score=41.92 TRINITY_DN3441_c0_g1_i1:156-632(-)
MSELKPVSESVFKHIENTWEKQTNSPGKYAVVQVQQVFPSKEILNRFEERRTELDRKMPYGEKLQTLQLYFSPTEDQLRGIFNEGFSEAFSGAAVTFFKDPVQAIEEGFISPTRELLLCRVSLGREGSDHSVQNGRYAVSNSRTVMPSFLLTYTQLRT